MEIEHLALQLRSFNALTIGADEVVNDLPTPEEVAAFWAEVRPEKGIPF
jgi:hypothetical protein